MAVDWGSLAQVGLTMASQYANNRQQARNAAAQATQTQQSQGIAQNSQQNNVMLQLAQIEMLRKQMEQANRATNASQTARGDLLANVQDARFTRPAGVPDMSMSGGLRPSALGPNAREAGRTLSTQSLDALKAGTSFMPLQPAAPIDLNAGLPQESAFDKLMAGVGAVGGAVQGYQQTQRQSQQESALTKLIEQMQRQESIKQWQDAVRQYGGQGL